MKGRTIPEEIADIPPAAKLVYLVLEHSGPMTQTEICNRTYLPQSTVSTSLRRLEAIDVLETRTDLSDLQTNMYDISRSANSG